MTYRTLPSQGRTAVFDLVHSRTQKKVWRFIKIEGKKFLDKGVKSCIKRNKFMDNKHAGKINRR